MKKEVAALLIRAEEFLTDADWALEGERFGNVVNRSYYTIFTAARALLFEKG